MKKLFKALKRSETGQALGEYSILMTGFFMITIAIMSTTGEALRDPFCYIADTLNWPACAELQPGWGIPEPGDPPDPVEGEDPPELPAVPECHLLEEAGKQECRDGDCALLAPINNGEWTAPGENPPPIRSFVLVAGAEYHIYQSGITMDGCYRVDLGKGAGLPANEVHWTKISNKKKCKDVTMLQAWMEPLCDTFCHCDLGHDPGKNCHKTSYNNGHAGHPNDFWTEGGMCTGWHH